MNRTHGVLRARRGRDVMDLLAKARPASLDDAKGTRAPELAANLAAQAGPDALAEPPARPGRPAQPARRAALAGAGLTLTAAVAAIAVLAATAGTGAPASTAGASGAHPAHPAHPAQPARPVPSARAILLTAAVNAAKAPARGRYWRVEVVSGNLMAAGPNARPYAVGQLWSPFTTWDARSVSRRSWTFPAARYTSVPASPGATAAWQADGSPKLPATHGRQQAWWQTGGGLGYFGNSSPTFAQFQALPSSPAGLAAAVRKAAFKQEQVAAPVRDGRKIRVWRAGGRPSLSQDIFGIYVQLLKFDPITPHVRATVFRNLAGLPGVRSVGKVTDPLGRAGYGIAMTPPKAVGGDEEVLVINSATGNLLADEFVVTKASADTRQSASGAVPGFTKCPAGAVHAGKERACIFGARVVHGRVEPLPAAGSKARISLLRLGPELALVPGQVDSYDVVVRAGWTNVSPKLPPLSRQFSVIAGGKG